MADIASFNDKSLSPEERERVSALPPIERQDLIETVLVRYPSFKSASGFVSKFHRPVDGGRHGRGWVGALLGDTRAGKSFVLQDYRNRFTSERINGGFTRPVVYVEVLNDMTAHDVASEFHLALGYSSVPKIKTATLMRNDIAELEDHHVELVILDDIDNALTNPKSANNRLILGFIKGILDSRTCNVLCSGRVALHRIISGFNQVEGRGSLPHVFIRPYRWRVQSERIQIRFLLDEIDNRLPFREKAGLGDEDVAAHFYAISGGLIGRMMNYVREAAYEAMNEGADRIEREHLVYAAKLRMAPGETFVPFKGKLDIERLDADPDESAGRADPKPAPVRKDMFDKKRPRKVK
jgi:hypothetical protein